MSEITWNFRLVSDGKSVGLSTVHYLDGVPCACHNEEMVVPATKSEDGVRKDFRKCVEWVNGAIEKPILFYPEDFMDKSYED